ncbi:unnamed protein product [Amoebophrya sp. A120]|nr:unnamed protein product [Amoebophrya sp. A120]|eukprot:GSA120T00003250001.1
MPFRGPGRSLRDERIMALFSNNVMMRGPMRYYYILIAMGVVAPAFVQSLQVARNNKKTLDQPKGSIPTSNLRPVEEFYVDKLRHSGVLARTTDHQGNKSTSARASAAASSLQEALQEKAISHYQAESSDGLAELKQEKLVLKNKKSYDVLFLVRAWQLTTEQYTRLREEVLDVNAFHGEERLKELNLHSENLPAVSSARKPKIQNLHMVISYDISGRRKEDVYQEIEKQHGLQVDRERQLIKFFYDQDDITAPQHQQQDQSAQKTATLPIHFLDQNGNMKERYQTWREFEAPWQFDEVKNYGWSYQTEARDSAIAFMETKENLEYDFVFVGEADVGWTGKRFSDFFALSVATQPDEDLLVSVRRRPCENKVEHNEDSSSSSCNKTHGGWGYDKPYTRVADLPEVPEYNLKFHTPNFFRFLQGKLKENMWLAEEHFLRLSRPMLRELRRQFDKFDVSGASEVSVPSICKRFENFYHSEQRVGDQDQQPLSKMNLLSCGVIAPEFISPLFDWKKLSPPGRGEAFFADLKEKQTKNDMTSTRVSVAGKDEQRAAAGIGQLVHPVK